MNANERTGALAPSPCEESQTIHDNRPTLRIYRPNGKCIGAALRTSLIPATATSDGALVLSLANQKTLGDLKAGVFPSFDWPGSIVVRLGFDDLCEVLRVFRGECESIADGKGIFIRSERAAVVFRLSHMVEPVPCYKVEVHRKIIARASKMDSVSILLTPGQALGLSCAIEGCMTGVVFGTIKEGRTMGEYAIRKSDGAKIKLGTCEGMYYLRLEQLREVVGRPDSINPARLLESLWFRLPRVEESGNLPGDFDYCGPMGARPVRLLVPETVPGEDGKRKPNPVHARHMADLEKIASKHPGTIQLHTDNGVLVNVPCFHGAALPLPAGMHYNGHHAHQLAAFAVGVRNGAPAVLVGCYYCRKALMWYDVPEFVETFEPFGDEADDFAHLLAKLDEYGKTYKGKAVQA